MWTVAAAGGSTFTTAGNSVNILATTGGYATFAQITNMGTSNQPVQIQLNGGGANATFTLEGASSQVFNVGDLLITSIAVANNASGATLVNVQILASVMSPSVTTVLTDGAGPVESIT